VVRREVFESEPEPGCGPVDVGWVRERLLQQGDGDAGDGEAGIEGSHDDGDDKEVRARRGAVAAGEAVAIISSFRVSVFCDSEGVAKGVARLTLPSSNSVSSPTTGPIPALRVS
jgi:hypothetical protein